MIDDRLRAGARELGVELNDKQLEKFTIFLRLLEAGNKKANLVGDAGPDTVISHHFLDSLSCLKAGAPRPGNEVLDLGSGAGFPGIPLAIAVPGARFTLLDASVKRTAFLTASLAELGLSEVVVSKGRAEMSARREDMRQKFDVVTARAVGPMTVLAEYALPFLKTGGVLIAQRGPKADIEAAESARAIAELGGSTREIIKVKVPFLEAARRLVVIQKERPTPDRYPRRTGVPLKRPLV
jgi:16S rRNA (guanine527-N7)-methyltransferase